MLTTLDLQHNRIEDEGTKYIADLLARNQVKWWLPRLILLMWNHRLKTLTTLDLLSNNIGDEGAKHLAHALALNQVRYCLTALIFVDVVLSFVGTNYPQLTAESNQRWRSQISRWRISSKSSEIRIPFSLTLFKVVSSIEDTHYFGFILQPYSRWRSQVLCRRINSQPSEILIHRDDGSWWWSTFVDPHFVEVRIQSDYKWNEETAAWT